MLRQTSRFIDVLANSIGYFAGCLVLLMMLLTLFEVFMRYVIGRAPLVADEFGAYMYVALSFFGLAYTWKHRGHVRITALVHRLPIRVANWLRLITLALACAFTITLTHASYGYLVVSFRYNMKSGSVFQTPLQGPQMTMAIGYAVLSLMLILEVARAVVNLKAGKDIEEVPK